MADAVQPATRNVYIRPWNAQKQEGKWRYVPRTTKHRAVSDKAFRRHLDVHAGRFVNTSQVPLDRPHYPERKKRKPRFEVKADGQVVSEYAQHFSRRARPAPTRKGKAKRK